MAEALGGDLRGASTRTGRDKGGMPNVRHAPSRGRGGANKSAVQPWIYKGYNSKEILVSFRVFMGANDRGKEKARKHWFS